MADNGYSDQLTITNTAGVPVLGATVAVVGPQGYSANVVSDAATGNVRLGPLPVGDYTLTFGGRSTTIPVFEVAVGAGVYPVEAYRQTGDVGDGPAVLRAVAAAVANAQGGVVEFGAKVYNYDLTANGPIILPTRFVGPVHLRGAGRMSTRIVFTGDTGAGTFAIRGADTAGSHVTIRDLRLEGPGNTACANGTAPANVAAIRANHEWRLHDVAAVGWYSGAQLTGDHNLLQGCFFNQNFYGVEFGPSNATGGDQLFLQCDLFFNKKASVGIGNAGYMANTLWLQTGIGSSPYGIYAETGATGITDSVFVGMSWEACGNGMLVSQDRNLALTGVTFDGCGNVDWIGSGNNLPGNTTWVGLDIGAGTQVVMRNCRWYGVADATTPATFRAANGWTSCTFEDWDRVIIQHTAANKLMFAGSATNTRIRTGTVDGELCRIDTQTLGPAVKGNVMVRRIDSADLFTNTPGPAFGVCQENAVNKTGDACYIATSGRGVGVLASTACPQFTRVVVDAANPGQGKTGSLSAAPASQPIGSVAGAGTAAAGLVSVHLMIASSY